MWLPTTSFRLRQPLRRRFTAIAAFLAAVTVSLPAASVRAFAEDSDTSTPLFAATGTSPKRPNDNQRSLDRLTSSSPLRTDSRHNRPFRSEPVKGATLFINGEFVPSPFIVSTEGDRILVNGVEVVVDRHLISALQEIGSLDSLYSDSDPDNLEAANTDGDEIAHVQATRAQKPGTRAIARALAELLSCPRSIDVLFAGQPVELMTLSNGGLELLTALLTRGEDRPQVDAFLNQLRPETDRDLFLNWILTFESTEEFAGIVGDFADFLNESEARNRRDIAAVGRLRSMSYPMSLVGLLLSVVAFGHVVANKPPTRYTPAADDLTPEMRHMVNHSLLLVIALSLLDLIWTILASQANQMTELNPLGREFINNPALLGAFKFVLTGVGVGLLYTLKKHRIAQTAAWWACMILTLLTMRWLTFNSMFA
jgi:hypothetical protein